MSLAICPLHVLIFAFHFLRCENFLFFAKDFAILRKKIISLCKCTKLWIFFLETKIQTTKLSRSVNVLLTKLWISSQRYRQQKSSRSVNILFSKHWTSPQKDIENRPMNSCAKSFEMCLTPLWNGIYVLKVLSRRSISRLLQFIFSVWCQRNENSWYLILLLVFDGRIKAIQDSAKNTHFVLM